MNSAFVPLSVLMADRVLPGAVLITGLVNAALFACLSGATYVPQGIFGLSPQGYSFAFHLNCAGFMVFGFASGRLSERWSEKDNPRPRHDASARGRAAGYRGSAPAAGSDGAVPAHQGQRRAATTPPFLWLALAHYPEIAGTASSPMGPARFAFGGLAAPLVGSGGAGTAVPIGMVAVACRTLAVIVRVLAYAPTPGWGSTSSPGGPIDPVTANS
ncbi:hypothetical protein [Streptomyces variegatus]|uniref:hypothetical protein n=1 Tax=Streptomyces variegatus TaxID=284040 RepID=UPI003C2ABCE5